MFLLLITYLALLFQDHPPVKYQDIEIFCATPKSGSVVICNEYDYQELISDKDQLTTPFCAAYQLPKIDFTKNTLIGYYFPASGHPTYKKKIYLRNDSVIIDVIIKEGFYNSIDPISF